MVVVLLQGGHRREPLLLVVAVPDVGPAAVAPPSRRRVQLRGGKPLRVGALEVRVALVDGAGAARRLRHRDRVAVALRARAEGVPVLVAPPGAPSWLDRPVELGLAAWSIGAAVTFWALADAAVALLPWFILPRGLAAPLLDLPADRLQDGGQVSAVTTLGAHKLVDLVQCLHRVPRGKRHQCTPGAVVDRRARLPLQPRNRCLHSGATLRVSH
mmetsp:Transcript_61694/g.180951  ORF Transcript_61694/g.180951 Transcript_61694/m.180951 type:complete len:214 (+) Transcript_61694:1090-1731(+)